MNGLELLLIVAGLGVTVLVIAGMILLAPLGVVEVHTEGADPQGSNLSARPAPERASGVPTRA